MASALTAEDVQAIVQVVDRAIDKKLADHRDNVIGAVMLALKEEYGELAGMVSRQDLDESTRGWMDGDERIIQWVKGLVVPDVMTGVVHEAWARMVLGETMRLGLVGRVMEEEVETNGE